MANNEKKVVPPQATEESGEEGRRDFVTKAIGAVLAAGVVGGLLKSEDAQAADPPQKAAAEPVQRAAAVSAIPATAFKLQSLPNGVASKLSGADLAKLIGHESLGSQLAGKNMSVTLTWD